MSLNFTIVVPFRASKLAAPAAPSEMTDETNNLNAHVNRAHKRSMNTLIESRVSPRTPSSSTGVEETLFPTPSTPERNSGRAAEGLVGGMAVQWSWACRKVQAAACLELEETPSAPPVPGDLALVRLDTMGFHKHPTTCENRRLRLYPGVQFIGVFGNRYASDAFEAEVQGTDNLSLLTGAGMIGTVKSKYDAMADPTRVSLLGLVRGADGRRLNLKDALFRPTGQRQLPGNVIYIVGTSMNSGKTTTGARLIHGLSDLGLSVVACKLTGSVSNHDPDEMAAAAARKVTDFSDFGFASTYLATKQELMELFYVMMAEVSAVAPDVVLVEFADGLL